jgi:hypothetical protein
MAANQVRMLAARYGPNVTSPEHNAPIQDVDVTVPGIAAPSVAMTIMSVLCLGEAACWYFGWWWRSASC